MTSKIKAGATLAAISLLALLVASCGGGGDSDDASREANRQEIVADLLPNIFSRFVVILEDTGVPDVENGVVDESWIAAAKEAVAELEILANGIEVLDVDEAFREAAANAFSAVTTYISSLEAMIQAEERQSSEYADLAIDLLNMTVEYGEAYGDAIARAQEGISAPRDPDLGILAPPFP